MGYCTDVYGRLSCDECGTSGDTHKRACPATVTVDDHYGRPMQLPVCPAAALCRRCWPRYSAASWRATHARCFAYAAAQNAPAASPTLALES